MYRIASRDRSDKAAGFLHMIRGRSGYTLAVALFSTAVVGYFAPAFFRGEILLPSAFVHLVDPTYAAVAPPEDDFNRMNPILGGDRVFQFHPWAVFNIRAIRNGEFPLWNPYSGAGTPHLALEIPSVLDPLLTGAGLVVGGERAGTARSILSVWLAGIGIMIFARRRGLSASAGLVGALAFSLGGWMILWLDRPLVSAACWLPWILWGIDRVIRTDRPAASSFAIGFFVALSFLAGHLQTTIAVILLAAVFAVYEGYRVIGDWKGRCRKISLALVSVAIGAAFAAPLVIPFAEFLFVGAGVPAFKDGPSMTVLERVGVGLTGAMRPMHVLHTLLTAVVPVWNISGNPPYAFPPPNLAESTIYVGVVPLLIVLLAQGNRYRDRQTVFWGVVAICSLCLALNFPLFNLIDQLPPFRWTNTGRFRLLYCFGAAMASACALDRMRERESIPDRVVSIGIFALALGAIGTALLIDTTGPRAFVLAMTGWTAGILCLIIIARVPQRFWPVALVALTGSELVVALRGAQPTHPPEHVLPETPTTEFLKAHTEGRIAGLSFEGWIPPLAGALPLLYELNSITAYHVIYPRRLQALMSIVNDDAGLASVLNDGWLVLEDPGDRLIDLLGVQFLITRSAPDSALIARSRLLEQFPIIAWTDGNATIWENPDPLPQAFVVDSVVAVDNAESAASILQDPDFDFRSTAIVESPDQVPWLSVDAGESSKKDVIVLAEGLGEYRFLVKTPASGLLVVTQSYDKGWTAEVDGRPVAVFPTDLAFLGVPVPAGEHYIQIRYMPRSFHMGLLVSLSTVLIMSIIVAIEIVRLRRFPHKGA